MPMLFQRTAHRERCAGFSRLAATILLRLSRVRFRLEPPNAMNSFVHHYRARPCRKSAFKSGGVIAILLVLANTACFAQEAPAARAVAVSSPVRKENASADATAMPAVQPSGLFQYVGPDTFILLDSQGRPQPVPGMTYEDFVAAWKKLNQPTKQDSQPRYTIERITF